MDDLRTMIEKLLNRYSAVKFETYAGHEFASYVRKECPNIIRSAANITSDVHFKVKGSVGQTNWATCPWIAISNKLITKNVTEGVSVVYIYSEDPRAIYLTLNQGCQSIEEKYKKETPTVLESRSKHFLSYFENTYDFFKGKLEMNVVGADSKYYKDGSILAKKYSIDSLPTNDELVKDLKQMLDLYSIFVNHYLSDDYIGKDNIPDGDFSNFFDYLNKEKLCYSKELIEYFLLSLKVKPFVILSGGSGTGKTKLAQKYAQFLGINRKYSTNEEAEEGIVFNVTLGKSAENKGYTINSKLFFSQFLNMDDRKKYDVKIGNLRTTCNVVYTPRIWFTGEGSDEFSAEINRLKEEGKDNEELIIYRQHSIDLSSGYQLVPVGSNWTESRFIVGFKNVLNGNYESTPALRLIKQSNNDLINPYLLILDEMNLSHVERYFSDILSAMESNEPIKIDDDCDQIRLCENLFIVGTVNIDETTYAFSPKVLDRANVIEFELISVGDYLDQQDQSFDSCGDLQYLFDCMKGVNVRKMGSIEIISELNKNCSLMVETMKQDLDRIHKELSCINQSFGFRTIDEIMRFMYVSYEYMGSNEFEDWIRFFDAQIKQKILPKIHGNQNIKDTLVNLKNICERRGYNSSKKKLDQMISVLERQKYVTFNC